MAEYLNLKKNERSNFVFTTIILTITIGSFISLQGKLIDRISIDFSNWILILPQIIIFCVLFYFSVVSLRFYFRLIVKLIEPPTGISMTILLSSVPTVLILWSIYLPNFIFIWFGLLFIFIKSCQLRYYIFKSKIGANSTKYIKSIFWFYFWACLIVLILTYVADIYIPDFLKLVSTTNGSNPNETQYLIVIWILGSILAIIVVSYLFNYIYKKIYKRANIDIDKVLKEFETYYAKPTIENRNNDQKTNSNQTAKSITAILTVIRPFVSGIAGFIASIVYFQTSTIFQFPEAILIFLIVFMTSAYGFVLNDYFDNEKDKIDHKNRPIPSGSFSTKNAILLSIILASISLFFSIFIGLEGLIINISTIFLLGVYSKINNKYGILANIITATICSFVLIIGMSAGSFSWIILFLSFATFFLILGREVILDIRDLNSDKAIGKASYPIKYGIKRSVNFAILLLSITTLFLFFTSVIANSIGFFIILGVIANLMLWIGIIDYRKSFDKEKLERFIIISRITFILMIPALFFI